MSAGTCLRHFSNRIYRFRPRKAGLGALNVPSQQGPHRSMEKPHDHPVGVPQELGKAHPENLQGRPMQNNSEIVDFVAYTLTSHLVLYWQ